MPVNCERCNKKFPDKSKFKRHLLRKTICKISKLGKDLTLKEIWNIHFKELDYDTEYKNKNCKKKKIINLYLSVIVVVKYYNIQVVIIDI